MTKICTQLAKQRGTTAEGIYKEMQEAISAAFNTPQLGTAADIRARVPSSGEIPTPEEMLSLLCRELQGGGQSIG